MMLFSLGHVGEQMMLFSLGRGMDDAFLTRSCPRIALRPPGAVQSCGIYSKSTIHSLGSARWALEVYLELVFS